MPKCLILLILLLPVFNSCSYKQPDKSHEEMKDLIYLRIEGLLLLELLQNSDTTDSYLEFQESLTNYYNDTQQQFLKLSLEQSLNFNSLQQEEMVEQIGLILKQNSSCETSQCLILIQNNISKSIQAYTQIVQNNQHDQLSYFSFLALPQLFNIQEEGFSELVHFNDHQ